MESRGGILNKGVTPLGLHLRDRWQLYGGWIERGKEQRRLGITVGA